MKEITKKEIYILEENYIKKYEKHYVLNQGT